MCYVYYVCVCVLKEFVFAKSMDGSDVEEIQEFLEESVRG